MFDYKLIEALAVVFEEQSFGKAAKKLRITQSAVSQRITLLEEVVGQALLLRQIPIKLTNKGEGLVQLYRQVNSLETDLIDNWQDKSNKEFTVITIASNADSLATWLLPAVSAAVKRDKILIRIMVDDQVETHKLLKTGEVIACITSKELAGHGCRSDLLGEMRYHCVATTDFSKRYFSEGLTKKSVLKAPAIVFNMKDRLHSEYLHKYFRIVDEEFPAHLVPSSEGFVDMALAGLGYALIPENQIRNHLKSGRLIDLMPGDHVPVKLYWHSWYMQSQETRIVFEKITKLGQLALE